jgi:CubicO group peptidase (beta-lactamase class C family)
MTQQISSIDTAAIRHEFNRQITDGLHSSAALAVFQNGEQIIDIVRGARNTNPLFRAFSMGKPLTAAVLWRYKARNLFEWDTPIADFWPEFGTQGKSTITIGHILSHTAGLASNESIPSADHSDWGRLISHIEDMTPATEPGTTVHYHSQTFGWIVGEVASRISGLPFDEAFKREVAFPLGLKNTSFTLDPSEFGRAMPVEAGPGFDETTVNDRNSMGRAQIMMPSGSMITTATDVAKFYSAISGKGKINGVSWLPEEVVSEVTSLHAEGPDEASGNYSRVGLGVRLPSQPPNQYASENNHDTVGHGGMATCTGWASLTNNVTFAYITNRMQLEKPNKQRLHRRRIPEVGRTGVAGQRMASSRTRRTRTRPHEARRSRSLSSRNSRKQPVPNPRRPTRQNRRRVELPIRPVRQSPSSISIQVDLLIGTRNRHTGRRHPK